MSTSYIGAAAAKVNAINEVMQLTDVGRTMLSFRNRSAVNVIASYYSMLNDKSKLGSQDTKYLNEDVYDTDNFANTPVAPGSIRFTSTGVPTLIDRDGDGILRIERSATDDLITGVDGVTSASASRTLTSAGSNFTTAGVVAGDLVYLSNSLSSGSSGNKDAGVYTVVTVGTTTLVVDSNWPEGVQSNVQFKVVPTDLNCGTVDYFTGKINWAYPSSPSAASPTSRGTVKGTVTVVGGISLAAGDTLSIKIDGGGAVVVTFDAAAATKAGGGGTFTSSSSETLVISVNGGPNQTITFGAGTETTAQQYADIINAGLIGAVCDPSFLSLTGMSFYLNAMKTAYNAHLLDVAAHRVADATNDITAADATDLASAQTLANELKADYNLHCAMPSEEEECVTLAAELRTDYTAHIADAAVHLAVDAVNTIAAPAPTTFAMALAVANEFKAKYNLHRSQAGVHQNNDAGNAVVSADATDLASCKTLLNEIKTEYNGHCAALSEVEENITLLNEIKANYNLHIADTTYHLLDDTATNGIVIIDATDLASCYTLANDIKAKYNAHRSSVGIHVNDDAGNNVVAADAATLAALTTLSKDIKAKINAHIIAASELSEANTLLAELKAQFELHAPDVTYHSGADATTLGLAPISLSEANAFANDAKIKLNAHFSSGVYHVNASSISITSPDATDIGTLLTLANELKADFNSHLIELSDLEECITLITEVLIDYPLHIADVTYHDAADAVNTLASVVPPVDLATAQTRANDIKAKYNLHRSQAGVHPVNDAGNAIGAADATNLATLVTLCQEIKLDFNAHDAALSQVEEAITLITELITDYEAHRVDATVDTGVHGAADAANALASVVAPVDLATCLTRVNDIKAKYNLHCAQLGGVHDNADVINTVGAADAIDVGTLETLANEIKADFNAHCACTGAVSTKDEAVALLNEMMLDYEAHRVLVAGGVHGGVDATNVLADTIPTSDDTPLATMYTQANDLKAKYEAHRVFVAGAVHAGADAANVVTAADANSLASLETLLNDIKTQYNVHITVQPAVHGIADAVNATAAANVGTADLHKNDDTTNTCGAANVGAAGVHLTDDVTNTISADSPDTAAIHLTDDVTNTMVSPNVGTAGIHHVPDITNNSTSNDPETANVHEIDDVVNPSTADDVGTAAVHLADDTIHTIAAPDATNLATLQTLVDELRTDYPLHRIAVLNHLAADVTNVVVAEPDTLDLKTDKKGTGATIQVVSGSGTILTKLGISTGTATGTGDVADISAVLFAEIKALVEADVGTANILVSQDGVNVRMTSATALDGASSQIQVSAGTARTKIGFDAVNHLGSDPDADQYVAAEYIATQLMQADKSYTHQVNNGNGEVTSVRLSAASAGGFASINADLIQLQ